MSIEVRFSSPHMPTKAFSSLEECINHKDYHQIEDLNCKGIGLTQLPDILPSNLKVLWCSYNNLTQLPNELPDTLQVLNCAGNQFTSLPNNLPPNIYDLICHSNQLVSLPDNLPIGLTRLHCSHNNIITLPPEIASTITIKLLLNPVEATAPTIIPAVAIAIATLIMFIAPFSRPPIILLKPLNKLFKKFKLFFFEIIISLIKIIIINDKIE